MSSPTTSPSLAGTWQVVRAELDAEAVAEFVARQTVLTFTDDTYAVSFDGEIADRGHYAIQCSADTPHASLILRGVEGPNAGRTLPAIYQQVGERLRICYGLDGTQPATFSTAPNSQRYLVTYRRRG